MKLVVTIVNKEDAPKLSDALIEKGYGTTCIPSYGNFLQQENLTLLTGVADEKVKDVVALIRKTVRWKELSTAGRNADNSMLIGENDHVIHAGATLFVVDVEQFLQV